MDRFSVKQLLDHEFFSEGEMKVDLVRVDGTQLVFKMEGPQRLTKNGQDMVQFIYNMDEDKPDSVVSEMVSRGFQNDDQGFRDRSVAKTGTRKSAVFCRKWLSAVILFSQ